MNVWKIFTNMIASVNMLAETYNTLSLNTLVFCSVWFRYVIIHLGIDVDNLHGHLQFWEQLELLISVYISMSDRCDLYSGTFTGCEQNNRQLSLSANIRLPASDSNV